MKRITLIGNCQMQGIGECIQAMLGDADVVWHLLSDSFLARFEAGELDARLARSDRIFLHQHHRLSPLFEARQSTLGDRIRKVPQIVFPTFHPDMDYVFGPHGTIKGPMGEYHSALVFHAWRSGLDALQARALFREHVFRAAGYFDYQAPSTAWLAAEGHNCGLPLQSLMSRWSRCGVWMLSSNHPKLFVLADVAQALLAREGLRVHTALTDLLPDPLTEGPVWPVYPEIARALGLEGHYQFKPPRVWQRSQTLVRKFAWFESAERNLDAPYERQIKALTLDKLIETSYSVYGQYRRDELKCERADAPRFRNLPSLWHESSVAPRAPRQMSAPASHPYAQLPDHHF